MFRKTALAFVLVCLCVSCSTAPKPTVDIAHDQSVKDAVGTIVSALMDLGLVPDQANEELGLVSTEWTPGSSFASVLVGPNDYRYVVRVKEGVVEVNRFTRIGTADSGYNQGKGDPATEHDPLMIAIRDALGGRFVVRPAAENK